MSFKKSVLIWSCIFLIAGSLILFLAKMGFTSTQDSVSTITYEETLDTINPNNLFKSFLSKEAPKTPEPEEEEIDYDAIDGLTDGPRYSEQLVSPNSKNILFTGSDSLSGLNDTIGIFSIDKESKKLKVIMIPRDLYIDYNLKVRHYLDLNNRNRPDYYKINSAHYIGPFLSHEGNFNPYSINFLADVIHEVFDITIDDYISLNPQGFSEVVDLFGGVNIYVPYDMYYRDPFQDLSIELDKGSNWLNGEDAEGFVRFRQYYDEDGELVNLGDFERKRNQINFIKAFIDQHGTISNIDKLPELLGTLSRNVRHSIGVGNILTSYMGLSRDIISNDYEFETITITGTGKIMNRTYYLVIE
ncbi:LCP family protein [Herbivorax sp. ANBcel31]|uniref:LCP family protein n=1 Tax=Herbivorax sp. ANBcel31 TaxID=3069754 RepID=UPI0027B24A27|nr:LCP family protein [Herbivorax sp. ANBcel31]MDQ2086808.1 LCP family protein [Herbivorax sp. ANBcel31]